jgi:hypothetical protein
LIFAEIEDLYKVNGHVFASDEHFATRLGIGLRTVGDAIKQLHEHGLLTRTISPKARHKRVLIPTLSGPNSAATKAECLRIPQEQSPTVKANSAASTSEICNESLRNPPAVPAKSADINTRVNNQLNSNLTFRGKAALAAPLNEKKETVILSPPVLPTDDPSSPCCRCPPSPGSHLPNPPNQFSPVVLSGLRFPAEASSTLCEAFTSWVSYRQKRGRPLPVASYQMQLDELGQYQEEFSLALIKSAIQNGTQGLTYPETKRKHQYWLTNRYATSSRAARPTTSTQQRLHAPVNVSYGQL